MSSFIKMGASALAAILMLSGIANADTLSHPDSHAPIGVMGDHLHKQGEIMLSYRYERMGMSGNRSGTDNVSTTSILAAFPVAPTSMNMNMHMFGAMYAPTDSITLMAMVPYTYKHMRHITRTGVRFGTNTEGFGDTKLSGLFKLYETGDVHNEAHYLLHAQLGASLPTGSVDERGNTPAGANSKLPYPMQLGSGTYDPILGLTYQIHDGLWSWGAQANGTLRFGENNSEGYRLGNEYGITSWVARNVTDYASLSLRLEGKSWDDINGSDGQLNPAMIPTARTDLRGGERLDVLVGLNLLKPDGLFAGHRLATEFGFPVYQKLDGPQLESDYRLTLGWQYAF